MASDAGAMLFVCDHVRLRRREAWIVTIALWLVVYVAEYAVLVQSPGPAPGILFGQAGRFEARYAIDGRFWKTFFSPIHAVDARWVRPKLWHYDLRNYWFARQTQAG
jgi:hypothetical protein